MSIKITRATKEILGAFLPVQNISLAMLLEIFGDPMVPFVPEPLLR